MKYPFTHSISHLLFLLTLLGLSSCQYLQDFDAPLPQLPFEETGTAEIYILNEGLFNMNNSTLTKCVFSSGTIQHEFFRQVNQRGLGDTGNDMQSYGGKLYIVMNVSGTVEVIDLNSGQSLRRIPMLLPSGASRQPRHIAFHRNKAYISSFDGTVTRIDTASLAIEASVTVGRNPSSLCVQGDKLYVANTGGLDHPHYDTTVSVINLNTFSETTRIEVGLNPGILQADRYGDVYVALPTSFLRIDSETDRVAQRFDFPVQNFTIAEDFAYVYAVHPQTKQYTISLFNIQTERMERENFITDQTRLVTPYSISVNPYSGNIYITDAFDFTTGGDLFCFDQEGKLVYTLPDIGQNPNAIVFLDRETGSGGGATPPPVTGHSPFVNKVFSYTPAPGQFMNGSTSAYEVGYTAEQVLRRANETITKRPKSGLLSLGAFGGSIVVGFDHPLVNKVGEADFKVYGNSFGTGSEPGIVQVSMDQNGNGLPDDEWYELKGSTHDDAATKQNYSVTYYPPTTPYDPLRWEDNQGTIGHLNRLPDYHPRPFFPLWMEAKPYTLSGTCLPANATNTGTESEPNYVLSPFPWGYADNHPNSSPLSNMDISWAIDSGGNPIHLPVVHFVRIYTAQLQTYGWIGESSTEFSTIEDLHPEL